jgi:hypothetical protein
MENGLYIDIRNPVSRFTAECALSNGDWAGIFSPGGTGIVSKGYQQYWKPAPKKKYVYVYRITKITSELDREWAYGPVNEDQAKRWEASIKGEYTILRKFEYEDDK